MRLLRALAAPAVALVLALALPVRAYADNGLRIEAQTNYDVQANSGIVKVTATINLLNTTVDAPGPPPRRLFFSSLSVPVPAEAANLTAVSDGAPLTLTTATINQFVSQATISFPNLFSEQRRVITLSYDIAAGKPRSDGVVRVNGAYVSFLAFAFGDTGIASVKISVPPPFQAETVGSAVTEGKAGDAKTFSATAISDVANFGVVVSARNDAALKQRDADVGDRDLLVLSWPNDTEWEAFAVKTIAQGVPVLEELIGQRWPIKGQLKVIEAATPYLRGYSGWFSPATNTIEIGERLDAESMLHELSHAWFNRDLFSDRWINEAFADEYARQAATKLGGKTAAATAPKSNDPARLKLAAWGVPSGRPQDAVATETYGYQASAWVLSELVREVGTAKLAGVIGAAATDTPAYGGAPGSLGDLKTDSRRLLDLLEIVGGSATASQLFSTYVLPDSDIAVLPKRAALRKDVAALSTDAWPAPEGLQRSMERWDFATAEAMVPAARQALAMRDQIGAALAPLGVSVPQSLKESYENAQSADDLRAAADLGARQLSSVSKLAAAKSSLTRDRSLVDKIGLLFASPEHRFADAVQAFDEGRLEQAEVGAERVAAQLDGATGAGVVRLGGGGGALALAVGLVALARKRRRPSPLERAAAAFDRPPSGAAVAAPPPAPELPEWPLPDPQPPIEPPPSPWTPITDALVEGEGDDRLHLLWPRE